MGGARQRAIGGGVASGAVAFNLAGLPTSPSPYHHVDLWRWLGSADSVVHAAAGFNAPTLAFLNQRTRLPGSQGTRRQEDRLPMVVAAAAAEACEIEEVGLH
jgi:hypothetical protein